MGVVEKENELNYSPIRRGWAFLELFVISFSPHYVFWLISLWFHGLPMRDRLQTSYKNSGRFVWRLPSKMDRIVFESMLLDCTQVFMMIIIPNVCWESRCTRHLRHRGEKVSLAAMRNPYYHREHQPSKHRDAQYGRASGRVWESLYIPQHRNSAGTTIGAICENPFILIMLLIFRDCLIS